MIESRYLNFVRLNTPSRKTPVVEVRSKSSGDLLGTIKWYGAWRQFCFYPMPHTIFNTGCMTDVQAVIAKLMYERKRAQGGEPLANTNARPNVKE